MKITFLRHCRSIFNELLYSDKDCDLSVRGVEQAKQLEGDYDVVICSVMRRARRTLELSKIRTGLVEHTMLCREWRNDICDFLDDEDQEKERESKQELAQRVDAFCSWVKSKYQQSGKRILVVTHADFVFCLTGGAKYLENGEFFEYEL
jgi:broad specificity phosphatase PhoE